GKVRKQGQHDHARKGKSQSEQAKGHMWAPFLEILSHKRPRSRSRTVYSFTKIRTISPIVYANPFSVKHAREPQKDKSTKKHRYMKPPVRSFCVPLFLCAFVISKPGLYGLAGPLSASDKPRKNFLPLANTMFLPTARVDPSFAW